VDGRTYWKALFGLAAALLVMSTTPAEVAAECTQLDRWPSFRNTAPSAEVIVIGDIVANREDATGYITTDFRLRVDEVLRGESDDVLEFRDAVRSGLPLTICPGDSVLYVRVGDRLAMAFGARYPEVDGLVTAVAFLNREPDPFLMPGIERLTREQIRAVADLPSTETVPIVQDGSQSPPIGLLLVGLVGGWLADRRLRKRAT
jgi:hypothetical protein